MRWISRSTAERRRTTVGVALLASCLMLNAASAQSPREFALTVIETNPQIQASWYEFLAASQDLRQARGSYLPSVDLSATTGRVDQENAPDDYTRTQAQLSVTQLLFDGFRVRREVGQAHQYQLIRYYELLDNAEQVVMEGMGAYYDNIRYRQLVELAQDNLNNHQRVYGQIQDRVRTGLSTNADLSQITGRQALAESNLMTETSNLHDVTQRYLRLSGTLPSQSAPAGAMLNVNLPSNVNDVLGRAYTNSPAFHAAVTGIEAADQGVELRRSRYMPTVEVRARHTHNDNLYGVDRTGLNNGNAYENVVELVVNYNLFRGNSDRAATRAAYERANRARALRDQACVDLRQNASIAFNNVRTLETQLNTLITHRDNAIAVADAYQEQWSIGQRGLLDVLDAQNESFQARRAVVHAEHDLMIARLQTLAVTGELLSTLGVSRSDMPSLSDLNARPVEVDPAYACMR